MSPISYGSIGQWERPLPDKLDLCVGVDVYSRPNIQLLTHTNLACSCTQTVFSWNIFFWTNYTTQLHSLPLSIFCSRLDWLLQNVGASFLGGTLDQRITTYLNNDKQKMVITLYQINPTLGLCLQTGPLLVVEAGSQSQVIQTGGIHTVTTYWSGHVFCIICINEEELMPQLGF